MPFVNTALFSVLLENARDGEDLDAVVAEGDGPGRLEPLCAWYAPACADVIERAWRTGDRSLHGLFARMRTRVVPKAQILACGAPSRLFFNVNTPDDLVAAREMAAADDAATRGA